MDNIGIVMALTSIGFLILGLTNVVNKISVALNRQNELKEKELKAKYPDTDI